MKRVSRLWVLSTFVIFASPEDSLAVQVSPDVRQRYVAARTLMGEERYAEAWEALQRLIIDEPEFTPAYRHCPSRGAASRVYPGACS